MIAKLQGTGDTVGAVREAKVAPREQGKLEQPIFAAFALQAISALLNPKCVSLPLSKNMLRKSQIFLFEF